MKLSLFQSYVAQKGGKRKKKKRMGNSLGKVKKRKGLSCTVGAFWV